MDINEAHDDDDDKENKQEIKEKSMLDVKIEWVACCEDLVGASCVHS